ncbi:hypothetical protein COL08_27870 [Priestia megaterium]|uniref:hypothetical protein n=1 Tax=Priestia megaterium TaxID=1404 RepID=UPI000BFA4111|nr:hypothetical protein [Priestia megaterium]PFV89682.1 hypothetical protein COL08_27870 [Priestia megaterium]
MKKRFIKDVLSKEELYRLYYQETKTVNEIGEMYKFVPSTVLNLMDKYKMPRRKKQTLRDLLSKNELQRLYHDEGKTLGEIGNMYGFREGAISKLLTEYTLPKRTSHDYKVQIKHILTKEKMYELYREQEKTTYQIAEEYNSSPSYISALLKEYGIIVREAPFRERLSRVELTTLYIEQQLSAKDIANLYDVTPTTILSLIDEYGIKKRSKSEAFIISNQRNPNVNVDFFKTLSPELAYILGLWATDGSINIQGTISLSLIDKEVIEWVSDIIECKNPVKEMFFDGRKPFYSINFQNPIVKEIFETYEIVHKKTRILKFPTLPEEFIPYFIRGVFEGDGSISVGTTKRGHIEQSITFCGASIEFMKKIKEIIESVIGGDRKLSNVKDYNHDNDRYKNDFYIYTFGGREDVIKFGDWIYSGKFFGMERKYKKFEFLKEYQFRIREKVESAKKLLLQEGVNISEVIKDILNNGIRLSFKEMITKDVLNELYWVKDMSLYQIAELYQTSASVVLKVMEELGIPRRDFKYRSVFEGKLTKEILNQLYWEEELTLKQVGDIYETNASTILKYMKLFEIPRRQVVSKLAELTKEELHHLHWEEKLTLKEIGARYNIVNTAILKLMKDLEIPRRKRSDKVLDNLEQIISIVSGNCIDPENYEGTRKVLTWKCSKEHLFKRTPRELAEYGKWCPVCHGEERILKKPII